MKVHWTCVQDLFKLRKNCSVISACKAFATLCPERWVAPVSLALWAQVDRSEVSVCSGGYSCLMSCALVPLRFSLKCMGSRYLLPFLWRDWHSMALLFLKNLLHLPALPKANTQKDGVWEACVRIPCHTVSHRERPPNTSYRTQTSHANVAAWGEKRAPEPSDSTCSQCRKCVCKLNEAGANSMHRKNCCGTTEHMLKHQSR